jgi:hypothetical protein
MPPGQPGSKIASGAKLFEPASFPSCGLILGIKPFRPLEWVVFEHPQAKVIDVWPHDAVETACLIGQGASDDEDPPPQSLVGFEPQEAFVDGDTRGTR